MERGSGHLAKVGTLAAAIRCIEDLMKVRGQLATDDVPTPSQEVHCVVMSPTHFMHRFVPSTSFYCACLYSPSQSRSEESVSPGISSADVSPGDPEISLSCDERLEPVEIHDLDPLDLATVPPIFSTTPYFSYSSPVTFHQTAHVCSHFLEVAPVFPPSPLSSVPPTLLDTHLSPLSPCPRPSLH